MNPSVVAGGTKKSLNLTLLVQSGQLNNFEQGGTLSWEAPNTGCFGASRSYPNLCSPKGDTRSAVPLVPCSLQWSTNLRSGDFQMTLIHFWLDGRESCRNSYLCRAVQILKSRTQVFPVRGCLSALSGARLTKSPTISSSYRLR